MAIKVDKEKCIGCGTCAGMCPEIFEIVDGKSIVKKQGDKECAEKAAEACPTKAISVS